MKWPGACAKRRYQMPGLCFLETLLPPPPDPISMRTSCFKAGLRLRMSSQVASGRGRIGRVVAIEAGKNNDWASKSKATFRNEERIP